MSWRRTARQRRFRRKRFPRDWDIFIVTKMKFPHPSDLSDQIKDALANSDNLIVVCSPDTPGTSWVRREIELFQEMGKGDRIIPLLIAGEPDEAFPEDLRRKRVLLTRPDGSRDVTWEEIEPIAADVRPRKDERVSRTERRALLRLAAALLGCRYDELARRDAERQRATRRNRLTTAGPSARCRIGRRLVVGCQSPNKAEYCANYGERWSVFLRRVTEIFRTKSKSEELSPNTTGRPRNRNGACERGWDASCRLRYRIRG